MYHFWVNIFDKTIFIYMNVRKLRKKDFRMSQSYYRKKKLLSATTVTTRLDHISLEILCLLFFTTFPFKKKDIRIYKSCMFPPTPTHTHIKSFSRKWGKSLQGYFNLSPLSFHWQRKWSLSLCRLLCSQNDSLIISLFSSLSHPHVHI